MSARVPACLWCHKADEVIEGEEYSKAHSRLFLCQRCRRMFRHHRCDDEQAAGAVARTDGDRQA